VRVYLLLMKKNGVGFFQDRHESHARIMRLFPLTVTRKSAPGVGASVPEPRSFVVVVAHLYRESTFTPLSILL